jgi:hypothetical protein
MIGMPFFNLKGLNVPRIHLTLLISSHEQCDEKDPMPAELFGDNAAKNGADKVASNCTKLNMPRMIPIKVSMLFLQ